MNNFLLLSLLAVLSSLCSVSGFGWGRSNSEEGGKCDAKLKPWETSKTCIWPSTSKREDLPESCRLVPPKPEKMPDVFYKLTQNKLDEYFSQWQWDAKNRGLGENQCGMCGFKVRCRQLENAPTSMHCPVKEEVFIYDEECQKPEPCTLKMEKGGCGSPETMEAFHMITVMAAMSKWNGEDMKNMKYGHMAEQIAGVMMGIPSMDMEGMMGMFGKGGGKGKGKGSSSSESSSDTETGVSKSSSSEGVSKRVDALLKSVSGKSKEDMIAYLRDLSNVKDARVEELQERILNTWQTVTEVFSRTTRQVAELKDNESYMGPKMNCVTNKAGDGCLCCCNWHIPDSENNTCVNVEDDVIAFLKDFKGKKTES